MSTDDGWSQNFDFDIIHLITMMSHSFEPSLRDDSNECHIVGFC